MLNNTLVATEQTTDATILHDGALLRPQTSLFS